MSTTKTETSIRDLVGMIQRGELRLPEMQRRYVWRASRVRDLLDSLYRGYPSGSILVWEVDNAQPSRDLQVDQMQSPYSGHRLLLDGQQRLTSLSAILRGEPIQVRGRQRPIEILFNLDHPDSLVEFTEVEDDHSDDYDSDEEEDSDEDLTIHERLRSLTFVVGNRVLAQQKNWVSVTEVMTNDGDQMLLKKAGITSLDDPNYTKYTQRLQRLRNIKEYMYQVNILSRDLSYEEVAEIFVRVNSLGVKLRGSDLALAQITARWRDSLKLFEEFQRECEDNYMTLGLGLIVRTIVAMITNQSKFARVNSLREAELKEGWEKTKAGIRYAINFMKNNAEVEDETLLSSPMFFVAIAYYSQIRKEEPSLDELNKLNFWLHVANARGRFSRGSSESLLDADLRAIERGDGVNEMIETLRQQFGKLDFEPADFAGRGINSPLFPLVFMALRRAGATDWNTGLAVAMNLQGRQHRIQYHHIFPKSLLKGKFDRRAINEIANMAFVSGRTNRRISNKEPLHYISEIIKEKGEGVITAQAIPTDPDLHKIDNYPEFLNIRRKVLCDIVNKFLSDIKGDK